MIIPMHAHAAHWVVCLRLAAAQHCEINPTGYTGAVAESTLSPLIEKFRLLHY